MSHGLVSLEQVFHSVKLHAMSGMWRRGKGGGVAWAGRGGAVRAI